MREIRIQRRPPRFGMLAVLLASVWILLGREARAQMCVGDCNRDGRVAVSEIVAGVRIGLRALAAGFCTSFDANDDGVVDIVELVTGVANALCNCGGPCPTATPTPSPSPSPTPTPTATRPPTPTSTPTPSYTETQAPSPTPTPPVVGEVLFREGFERSNVRRIPPESLFTTDTGDWFLGDTASSFPEDCGESPHYGEILVEGGNRRLLLHSEFTDTDCSDNVFAGPVDRTRPGAAVLDIPVDPDVFVSFRETGQLSSLDECQAVFLMLTIDRVESLTYVLQHGSGWEEGGFGCRTIFHPRPLVLPPGGPAYVRNLFDDAAEAGLDVAGHITGLSLEVDFDGDATFDDVIFFRAVP